MDIHQKDLRTYQRRSTTRESGYHTCDSATGGECIVLHAQKYTAAAGTTVFDFERSNLELMNVFENNIGILAFGGYIFTSKPINIRFELQYSVSGKSFTFEKEFVGPISVNDWNNIGFHKEISLDYGIIITRAKCQMKIECKSENMLEFISFDMGPITKPEFSDKTLEVSFNQKTAMHIPYLYYLNTTKPFNKYLKGKYKFSSGRLVVLKSCNRCGRYLPINIFNEMNTLSFSLHCKKRAPCVHSTFRAYTIKNISDLSPDDMSKLPLENGRVVSYYGHQLECKACKKFFVNAPLNPQRNPQQYKEDDLRRRAIEVLVNHLLETNLIHFEFEKRTKKEFSEYIWNKFGKRCFKCGKKIPLDEMHLDHTMPLAYLYRLDESATCLCSTHNSQKSDNFPVDYYTEDELVRLGKITGLSIEKLHYKGINTTVLNLLVKNVVWFYDEFLMEPDYQKVRDGILTADKINDSLKRVIAGKVDLAVEYKKATGHFPTSVTIK